MQFQCSFFTVKPLNSRHLRVLENLSVTKSCPLLGGSLTKIFISGTKHVVRYSRHVRYVGCQLFRGFTVLPKINRNKNQDLEPTKTNYWYVSTPIESPLVEEKTTKKAPWKILSHGLIFGVLRYIQKSSFKLQPISIQILFFELNSILVNKLQGHGFMWFYSDWRKVNISHIFPSLLPAVNYTHTDLHLWSARDPGSTS